MNMGTLANMPIHAQAPSEGMPENEAEYWEYIPEMYPSNLARLPGIKKEKDTLSNPNTCMAMAKRRAHSRSLSKPMPTINWTAMMKT